MLVETLLRFNHFSFLKQNGVAPQSWAPVLKEGICSLDKISLVLLCADVADARAVFETWNNPAYCGKVLDRMFEEDSVKTLQLVNSYDLSTKAVLLGFLKDKLCALGSSQFSESVHVLDFDSRARVLSWLDEEALANKMLAASLEQVPYIFRLWENPGFSKDIFKRMFAQRKYICLEIIKKSNRDDRLVLLGYLGEDLSSLEVAIVQNETRNLSLGEKAEIFILQKDEFLAELMRLLDPQEAIFYFRSFGFQRGALILDLMVNQGRSQIPKILALSETEEISKITRFSNSDELKRQVLAGLKNQLKDWEKDLDEEKEKLCITTIAESELEKILASLYKIKVRQSEIEAMSAHPQKVFCPQTLGEVAAEVLIRRVFEFNQAQTLEIILLGDQNLRLKLLNYLRSDLAALRANPEIRGVLQQFYPPELSLISQSGNLAVNRLILQFHKEVLNIYISKFKKHIDDYAADPLSLPPQVAERICDLKYRIEKLRNEIEATQQNPQKIFRCFQDSQLEPFEAAFLILAKANFGLDSLPAVIPCSQTRKIIEAYTNYIQTVMSARFTPAELMLYNSLFYSKEILRYNFIAAKAAAALAGSDRAVLVAGDRLPGRDEQGNPVAGRYEIVSLLTETGGMGDVYLARDRVDGGRLVAAKVLLTHDRQSGKPVDLHCYIPMFRTEARAMQKTKKSKKTVDFLALGYDGKRKLNFMVMEYIEDAQTLFVYIVNKWNERESERRIQLQTAISALTVFDDKSLWERWNRENLALAKEICKIGREVHKKNIIFRDFNPFNFLVDKKAEIKLTDFGLALIKGEFDPHIHALGYPGFAAPEQYSAQKFYQAKESLDIYALGCVLYFIFTGRVLLDANDKQIFGDKIPNLKDLNPQIPDNLAKIISKCLELDPAARYQNTADLIKDLNKIKI